MSCFSLVELARSLEGWGCGKLCTVYSFIRSLGSVQVTLLYIISTLVNTKLHMSIFHNPTFHQFASMSRHRQSSSKKNFLASREYGHQGSHSNQQHVHANSMDAGTRCPTQTQNQNNTVAREGIGHNRGAVNSPFTNTAVNPNNQNNYRPASTLGSPSPNPASVYSEGHLTAANRYGTHVPASSTPPQANSYNTHTSNPDRTNTRTHLVGSTSTSNMASRTSSAYRQEWKTPPRQMNAMDTRLESSDDTHSSQGLHASSLSLHQGSRSHRFPSTMSMLSPLGPSNLRNDMGSDLSGLVSPSLASPRARGKGKEVEVQKSPFPFGKDGNASTEENKRVPYRMHSTFVHNRNITDPFVDRVSNHRSRVSSPCEGSSERSSWPSSSAASTPTSATFERFRKDVTCIDLPIPPPSLVSVQGKLRHTPEVQARLDVQKRIRENWIRTEAKLIANLSRLVITTLGAYQQSGKQEDYYAWKRAQTAFNDATNLEKRQTERRNLFLPVGMTAMRTGQANMVTDGSVAHVTAFEVSLNHYGSLGNQKEGRLLGWRMAFMERVCAETRIKDGLNKADEGDMSKGGRESLLWSKTSHTPAQTGRSPTLTMAEKKELRKKLVARIEQATNKRQKEA